MPSKGQKRAARREAAAPASAGCGCADVVLPLGERDAPRRPQEGVYPLRALGPGGLAAPGWSPPATYGGVASGAYDLGRGPVQFLGVWDTQPHLEPVDDELHKNLQPEDSPGGVSLRALLPRPLDYNSGNFNIAPGFGYTGALVLYVAAVDTLPPGWRKRASWPGVPAGAFINSFGTDNDSDWAAGLSMIRPQERNLTAASDRFGLGGNSDGVRYLARHAARPVLDLLGYLGMPQVECDLGMLAGSGARYVAAWLRFWWPRWDGVDPYAASDLDIPWWVVRGPARYPCHREAWHCAVPVRGLALDVATYATDLPFSGQRYQIASPIAGNWRATVTHNGDAADPSVFVGLELRNGARASLTTAAVAYNDHDAAAQLSPTYRHGGAAAILAGYDNTAGAALAALVNVSVIP